MAPGVRRPHPLRVLGALGRYVSYARTTPLECAGPFGPKPFMGVPHQRALVSIAQAVGLDLDQVGEASLRGDDRSTIDCTGALPELLT